MTNEKKEKDIKDNKTIIEPVEAAVSDKEKKSKKEPVKLLIDEDIKIARENTNDPTSVLLFNELILLKNVQEKVLRKNDFGVIVPLFIKNDSGKREKYAAIYNRFDLAEDAAEDIAQDLIETATFYDEKITIVKKNSTIINTLR